VRIKLDENLGRQHASLLRTAGHVAERVTEQGMSGAPDVAVWKYVCEQGYFFITLDLDFSDIRRYEPGTHPGVLLIRAHSKSRQAVIQVLERVLRQYPMETLAGCLAVADEDSLRVRRPRGAD
jgi:predicted nuclease of predicted toxin-antitoxin system